MSEKTNKSSWPGDAVNYTGITLLKGLSYLPFWLIYGISDLLALLLRYVVGYRKKVIRTNLELSFPEKKKKEIAALMGKFYRHFSDITLETIKGYSMSRESFVKRITFHGIEKMNEYFQKGESVIVLAMHYNNWEWSSVAQTILKHRYLVIYNPIRNNPQFEKFLLKIRERWGAQSIAVNKSARAALEFHKMRTPICLALTADQRPPKITGFWTTFMNQEACFNSGIEKIARKTNQPVFFHFTRKIRRGHYEASFIPLTENPAEVSDEDILLTYVRTMEKYIREAPEYYLWSHRRWKHKRPAGYPIY